MSAPQRTSTQITLSVWNALFLREALSRLFARRAGWFWLLAEPVFHVVVMIVVFTGIRVHNVGGIDTAIWLMTGMLAFFMFRRTFTQVMNAVDANSALFTYRQVKPVDTALVRAFLEGLLTLATSVILFAGAALAGHSVVPAEPLTLFVAAFGLWLLGLGGGLIASVASELVPELERIINLVMMPLYILSGVMIPLSSVPLPYRDWLLLNPITHGIEASRLGMVSHYHAGFEISISYLFGSALVCTFLGLVLYRRFAQRLITQ